MKSLTLLFLIAISLNGFAQTDSNMISSKTKAVTIGILQGGGSLIGADLEFLVSKKFGVQVGAGFVGFGAGLNYHFNPSIQSSFLSLQYWNQGIGDSFVQNAIGLNYVLRLRKLFTCQLGLAKTVSKGPRAPDNFVLPPVMLTYAIGIYIPW